MKVGDHVVPCYTPQCCETTCVFCQSPKTNLCPKIRSTQGQGVMPDGTVRFKDSEGKDIFHFMGYVVSSRTRISRKQRRSASISSNLLVFLFVVVFVIIIGVVAAMNIIINNRCSTMSEYTVIAEISCAKINPNADLKKACLFGCGVSTGLGAVWNTCKVETNSTVAVFGLGAVVSQLFSPVRSCFFTKRRDVSQV